MKNTKRSIKISGQKSYYKDYNDGENYNDLYAFRKISNTKFNNNKNSNLDVAIKLQILDIDAEKFDKDNNEIYEGSK